MTHLSESSKKLAISKCSLKTSDEIPNLISGFDNVCQIVLPPHSVHHRSKQLAYLSGVLTKTLDGLAKGATFIVIGEIIDLIYAHETISHKANYHLWIAVKRLTTRKTISSTSLPEKHFGALVYTLYEGSLQHVKTRIAYSYCPSCKKTTKDYGGKKHTYNSYGTLMSDVWRDIPCDLEGDINPLTERFADLFAIEAYSELKVLDFRNLEIYEGEYLTVAESIEKYNGNSSATVLRKGIYQEGYHQSKLILGDCLEELKKLPDNFVDFAFIDPPYNLGKNYNSYTDDLSIQEYFEWCDNWIYEVSRVLKPGRTLAILNIPLWLIRHATYLNTILEFQNWIAWDALSFPARMIMPAHYGIICYSKGQSRPLPGLIDKSGVFDVKQSTLVFDPLFPLEEDYCLRTQCIRKRNVHGYTDRSELTDLWSDIHRLKHNSRRVDHPCQLPPQLMYRLISIFTSPGELVLDCFNGAGTTTLSAQQLGRNWIGIEMSEKYYQIAYERHEETREGLDPFRKADRNLTEKNSPVSRMPKIKYEVPKKTLQLEVRRVSKVLGRLPTREDMVELGRYPIKYYDSYFSSWGEVCAAARHDGMSEERAPKVKPRANTEADQLSLFDYGNKSSRR